ncbi:MAG: hypothetical protein ABII00_16725 [Elusimicrobiota bacterium]
MIILASRAARRIGTLRTANGFPRRAKARLAFRKGPPCVVWNRAGVGHEYIMTRKAGGAVLIDLVAFPSLALGGFALDYRKDGDGGPRFVITRGSG